MARITIEDCLKNMDNAFDICALAGKRAKDLASGAEPLIDSQDKPTVIALREIAEESLPIESLKEKLIQEYQTVSPLDEEELSLDYSGMEVESKDETTENETILNQENLEDYTTNKNQLNEDDRNLNPENDLDTDSSNNENLEN